jgi:hypothetical protein
MLTQQFAYFLSFCFLLNKINGLNKCCKSYSSLSTSLLRQTGEKADSAGSWVFAIEREACFNYEILISI